MNAQIQPDLGRRRALSEWLESVGASLDLSETRLEQARKSYEAVGAWLAGGTHPWLADAVITAHGSTALGTAITPLAGDEFDVDAMVHLPRAIGAVRPRHAKAVVGARLAEDARYRQMLEEKGRCWRLVYAREFHLDLTPSIGAASPPPPAVLVPDKALDCWLPSNPAGFREWFNRRAALQSAMATSGLLAKRAEVAPFPEHGSRRGVLRRTIQLLKRHRDHYFHDSPLSAARPISIILTTLAAKSHESIVRAMTLDTEFDILLATVARMPAFITRQSNGHFAIANPTVEGENFADKWNRDAELPKAFYGWHARVEQDLHRLLNLVGEDSVAKHLNAVFGRGLGTAALQQRIAQLSAVRQSGALGIRPGLGLVTGSAGIVTVPRNTFYGR